LISSLGLYPEHRRPDRDNFITVNLINVSPANYFFFSTLPPSDAKLNASNLPYDYGSITQQSPKYLSWNNQPTMTAKDKLFQSSMGQRVQLSFLDKSTLNQLYCYSSCSSRPDCSNNGFPDSNNCNRCICPDGYAGNLCQYYAPHNEQSIFGYHYRYFYCY
ncbi:hypothetical protein HELRODRAFT_87103, partial [Helobdella robusta]|uniref:Metalloendopeptidase n=1 Tax=Helobdella robusta TaxID=6412 RepID=T1G6L6_HELRO